MKQPKINPVGLLERPEGFESRPRSYRPVTRLFASLLLAYFFAVTVITTAVSLGSYCLTSDGCNTRALAESVADWERSRERAVAVPATAP